MARPPPRKYVLTKEQRHMYKTTYADYTLSSKDLAPMEVKDYLSEIDFPLEGYESVRDAKLVSAFVGKTAKLPGYVAYRPQTKQLVAAFCGTTTLTQAVYDVRALHHRHPSRRAKFIPGIRKGLTEHDVAELVITGHSMGGTVSQLLLMDILRDEDLVPVGPIPLKLVVFGAPRSGNEDLVKYWCELLDGRRTKYGEGSMSEYSVKAYNDGVPALPPSALGYRHYAQSPFYFVHGRLYQVPSDSREYTLFYKFARRTIWLMEARKKGGDWKERYRAKVAKHSLPRPTV
ncbi:Alpha/Beta hydrolase protein [Mycena galopus ATCC 62051]|nr:Alpha/Beta hydrolase protein [Mycena galopus ATCC 62051]